MKSLFVVVLHVASCVGAFFVSLLFLSGNVGFVEVVLVCVVS